jgi:hypothetical protein
MSTQWRDALEAKLRLLFACDQERRAARDVLSRVLEGTEAERVAVACLKLSDGDLARLRKWVEAATADYRDVLAWAEYPRQMRLGPNAPPADQGRARREDMDEYAQWLKGS